MANSRKHVFLSYVRENTDVVLKLAEELKRSGVEVWLDKNMIKPGMRWKNAIREAIESGDYFLACFSDEYIKKDKSYMHEELNLAVEELRQYPNNRSWFIPVRLSECEIPNKEIGGGETLRNIQWVDVFNDWNGGLKAIVESVSKIKKLPPLSGNLIILDISKDFKERICEATEAWINNGRGADGLINGKSFFTAYCWLLNNNVHDCNHENYNENIFDFVMASHSTIGGNEGWSVMLRERHTCIVCRMSYKLENMGISLSSMTYICTMCTPFDGVNVVG